MLKALRRTKPPDIQRTAGELPGFWTQFGPSHIVGAANPLAIASFYRGMMMRCHVVSTLPIAVEVNEEHVTVPIEIIDQPDPSEDRQTTIARMEASNVLRGEVVAVLGSFDSDGYPQSLKVVDPHAAELLDSGNWKIGNKVFGPNEILHIVPVALPGESRGISVVELFRRLITAEIAAQEFQGNFYLSGGQPTTVLTTSDTDATPDDLQGLLQRYMQKVAGGNREPIVLPDTISVQTIGLSNADSQFLESRQWAVTDIANIVGVPAYLLGAPGSSSVYSNDFEQRRAFLDFNMRGSMYAIERGLSRLMPDGMKAKFETHSFLRLDPQATAATLQLEAGWMTIDEIRAVQKLPPLPNGAGQRIGTTVLPGAPAAMQAEEVTDAAM